MRTTICKEVTIDCAHQLPNYRGKCRDLHGHTYKIRVYVKGYTVDVPGHPNEGMVMDFGRLKDCIDEHIVQRFDHKCLNDLMQEVPTAENFAKLIAQILQHYVPGLCKVRVYETPTSYAEVEL